MYLPNPLVDMAILTVLPEGHIYKIKIGVELLRASQIDPSLPFRFGCCKGECGKCVIRVINGKDNLSKPTKEEQATLTRKYNDSSCRLACQCAILGDVMIETRLESSLDSDTYELNNL